MNDVSRQRVPVVDNSIRIKIKYCIGTICQIVLSVQSVGEFQNKDEVQTFAGSNVRERSQTLTQPSLVTCLKIWRKNCAICCSVESENLHIYIEVRYWSRTTRLSMPTRSYTKDTRLHVESGGSRI